MTWTLKGGCGDNELEVALTPPKEVSIGRNADSAICLPQKTVSRLHAQLRWAAGVGSTPGHWRIRDCASTSGTILNGTKLPPQREIRLFHGDAILITPWQFRVEGPRTDRTMHAGSQTLLGEGDAEESFEAIRDVQAPAQLAQGQLVRLLAASEEIATALTESDIAQAAVEALEGGTGFRNVAFLKPGDDAASIEVMAQVGAITGQHGEVKVSRSLLRRARNGIYLHRGGQSPGGTLNESLASLDIRKAICVPIESGSQFFGWVYMDSRNETRDLVQTDEAAGFASTIARLAGLSLSNIQRGAMHERVLAEKQAMSDGAMKSLIAFIDAKDPYTRGHSDRVSEFGRLLAMELKLDSELVEMVRVSGLVHDIGKIGVPDEILRKPGRLTDEEFAKIREHPEVGYAMLEPNPEWHDMLPGVIEHHERWDGRGYPKGLQGEKISLLGRILCVADCFDAMTSARAYRPARQVADVRNEIRNCLGTHFDPAVGEAFLRIPESEIHRCVRLSIRG